MNTKMIGGICVVAVSLLLGARSSMNATHAEEIADKTASEQKQEKEQWGQEAEGFRLSLRSQKESYAVGEAVKLDGLLKNVSDKDMWVSEIGGNLTTYGLVVICPDGKAAPLTARGERIKAKSERIASGYGGKILAGKSRGLSLEEFPGLYDMSQLGDYSLQVSRWLPSRAEPENVKKSVLIYSNVVKITIAAPKDADGEDDAQD